ncbi:MAG: hypothetical protein IJO11_00025 [Alphaproteobacteria bacterium]|nr:hypothetical protein [Alphaproteobacteria bacterium]
MSKKNVGQIFAYIFIGLVFAVGIGYFAPSFWVASEQQKTEEFIRSFEKKMPVREKSFIFPLTDAYMEQKIEAILSPFFGEDNVKAIVHNKFVMQQNQIEKEEILPETGVISQQIIHETTEGKVVQDTKYIYSTQKTKTQFTSYDVQKSDVLVFVSPFLNKQLGDFFNTQRQNLLTMIKSVVGYSAERGDSFQFIQLPQAFPVGGLFGMYDTQIRQMIAVSLVCSSCVFVVLGLIVPWFLRSRKQRFSFVFDPHDNNLYRNQITGNPEESLLLQAQTLSFKMPEVAVNILRKSLYQQQTTQQIRTGIETVFSPVQQSAIVLLCLGDKCVKFLFKRMTDVEVATFSHAMAGLGRVKAIEIQPILVRFCQEMNKPQDILEPVAQTQAIIKTALPAEKAVQLLRDLNISAIGTSVWDKLNNVSNDVLSSFLCQEYPQTVAEILYHLSAEKSSQILCTLPIAFATDVIIRLSSLQYINPLKIKTLEHRLDEQINVLMNTSTISGSQKAAALLSLLNSQYQAQLLKQIGQFSPQTADVLSKQLITFDDFAFWSEKDLSVLLKHIDTKTLALALAHADSATKDAFSRVITPQKWTTLLKRMNELRMERIQDIDISQRAIIQIAQHLIDTHKCKGKTV